MRIIRSRRELDDGAAHLVAVEPRFAQALAAGGPPPLRRRKGGFAALFEIIVEQQVSVASGRAIWARIEAAGATTPEAVLALDAQGLRALGLSGPKARYAHEIARAAQSGAICFERQRRLPCAAAIAELVAVKGVGPWTAEVYQMFCVGRPDLFPVADIALQEAARGLFGLAARPEQKRFAAMAEPWSPWRAVAARVLWSYYRVLKGREGKA